MRFQKGHKLNLGKKRSEETKEKISKTLIGRKVIFKSEKTREDKNRKIRLSKIGHIVTKETREKLKLSNLGKQLSKETRKKQSITLKNGYDSGKIKKRFHSLETKQRISSSLKGRKVSNLTKEKHRISAIKQLSEGKMPQTNTLPHRLLRKAMQDNNLWKNFQDEVSFKWGSIDIGNSQKKIAIYVDGNYWHNYPNGNPIDKSHTTYLENRGWKVLRFWESDIKANIGVCIDRIRSKV